MGKLPLEKRKLESFYLAKRKLEHERLEKEIVNESGMCESDHWNWEKETRTCFKFRQTLNHVTNHDEKRYFFVWRNNIIPTLAKKIYIWST